MASRQFFIPDIGEITISKRKSSKHMRISIDAHNKVRVSQPLWVPYRHGLTFATQKTEWIQQRRQPVATLEDDTKIGKFHRLIITKSEVSNISTRVSDRTISIKIPNKFEIMSEPVQEKVRQACIRALKKEAESLLPQRLATLAERFDYTYTSVKVKHLKSRWGSCTSNKEITLNCLLMQVSWSEIDYVILHELAHTKHMSHNSDFWSSVGATMPDYRTTKAVISKRKPVVFETT